MDHRLTFIKLTGARYYLETDPDFKIWLCDVAKYVFGEFPKIIYIRLC